jgi:hypothetical protein
MLQQWQASFELGRELFPAAANAAAAAYLYLAHTAGWFHSPGGRAYVGAAALCVGIVPYTLAVIMPTNRALLARAARAREMGVAEAVVTEFKEQRVAEGKATREEERESSKFLVDRWGVLNLGRSVLLFAGAAVGVWNCI